jgi:hypothetical protein
MKCVFVFTRLKSIIAFLCQNHGLLCSQGADALLLPGGNNGPTNPIGIDAVIGVIPPPSPLTE